MALTPEQTEAVKNQLIKNIEKSFPADKQEFAKQQILPMNSEQLEEFLKRNKIEITDSNKAGVETASQCIFCSIVSENTDSYKIDENKESVAVLEINPLSKGHTIIIPKKHISSADEIPFSVFSLGKKVSKKIREKLNPKKVDISLSNILGHEIINVVPVYNEETPSEKKPAKPGDLSELQKTLSSLKKKKTLVKKPRKKKINLEKSKKPEKNLWLPKRIP